MTNGYGIKEVGHGASGPRRVGRSMPRVATPWFRMYSSILTNSKIQSLRGTDGLHWMNLMAVANVQRPRGSLPDMKELGFQLRLGERAVISLIERLSAAGLVDTGGTSMAMHDWEEWQADSDLNLTPGRQRRHEVGTPLERATPVVGTFAARIDKEEDKDKDKEEEQEEIKTEKKYPARVVAQLFENCFGRLLSPMELEQVKALEEEHPFERIEYACREASALNKRGLRYIQAVCEKQEVVGDDRNAGRAMAGNGSAFAGPIAFDPLGVKSKREFYVD